MAKAFKVFKLKRNKLISAGRIPNKLKFVFSKTKKNVPSLKGSKFFCFVDEVHARKFASNLPCHPNELEVWEVRTGRLIKCSNIPPVWMAHLKDRPTKMNQILNIFWNNRKNSNARKKICDELIPCIDSAHITDSVKLIRKLT